MLVNIDVLSGIVLLVIFVIAGVTPFAAKAQREEERLSRRPLLRLVRGEASDEEQPPQNRAGSAQ